LYQFLVGVIELKVIMNLKIMLIRIKLQLLEMLYRN